MVKFEICILEDGASEIRFIFLLKIIKILEKIYEVIGR